MQSIKLTSHVGADGVLKLHIPLGLPDTELEVVVVLQPLAPASQRPAAEELGWPPGFFEETAGALQGDPLVREPQGEYEVREELEQIIQPAPVSEPLPTLEGRVPEGWKDAIY